MICRDFFGSEAGRQKHRLGPIHDSGRADAALALTFVVPGTNYDGGDGKMAQVTILTG
jgi:hypothetical protein